MAKETKEPETIADLELMESMEVNGMKVTRVPGGMIYLIGSTSTFVPLTELALQECGLTLND